MVSIRDGNRLQNCEAVNRNSFWPINLLLVLEYANLIWYACYYNFLRIVITNIKKHHRSILVKRKSKYDMEIVFNENFSTTMQFRSQFYFTTQSPSLSITSYKSKFKSSSIFLNIKNKCMYAPTLDNCIFYVIKLLMCHKIMVE